MRKYIFSSVFILSLLALFGCFKQQNVNVYNAQAHLDEELPIIQKYIAENNFQYTPDSAFNKNGIFYQVISPGVQPDSGKYIYKYRTILKVKYSGKILGSSSNFDQKDSVMLGIPGLISCWQLVVPKVQPKGRVRFITTSVYGYQDRPNGSIPANSILDFDVEVLGVSEQ